MRVATLPLWCCSIVSMAQSLSPQIEWSENFVRVSNRSGYAIVSIFVGAEREDPGNFRFISAIWDNLAPDHESNELAPGETKEFRLSIGASPVRRLFAVVYSNGDIAGDDAPAHVLLRARRDMINALDGTIDVLMTLMERHASRETIIETVKTRRDKEQFALRTIPPQIPDSDFSSNASFHIARYLVPILEQKDPEAALLMLQRWRNRLTVR